MDKSPSLDEWIKLINEYPQAPEEMKGREFSPVSDQAAILLQLEETAAQTCHCDDVWRKYYNRKQWGTTPIQASLNPTADLATITYNFDDEPDDISDVELIDRLNTVKKSPIQQL